MDALKELQIISEGAGKSMRVGKSFCLCGVGAAILLVTAKGLFQDDRLLGVLKLCNSTMNQKRKDVEDGSMGLRLLLLSVIPILLAVVSASDAALSYRYVC
jgi:hypothetical protein